MLHNTVCDGFVTLVGIKVYVSHLNKLFCVLVYICNSQCITGMSVKNTDAFSVLQNSFLKVCYLLCYDCLVYSFWEFSYEYV